MTATVKATPRESASSSRQVALQLARIEARRVVLHPATIVGFGLALWAMWGLNWGEAPVLNRAGADTSLPLVLIGAGGLIAVSEAAMRMWRTERSEAIDITPASPNVRATALLVAVSSPVVLALALQLAVFGMMVINQPVTNVDWWDALAGPVTVALLCAAGVAAGRWVPSRLTGPLLLVLLLGVSLLLGSYGMRQRFGDWTAWLAPLVPLEFDPVELAFRPTGRHLLYLTALLGVFATLALLRGPRRLVIPVTTLVVALGLVVTGVGLQSRAFQRYDYDLQVSAYLPPQAEYICQDFADVTYCAYPSYQGWIEEWAALVQPVVELAPDNMADRPLLVRQYPTRALDILANGSTIDVDYEPGLATGMWWGRQTGGGAGAGWGDAYPFGMALGAASWVVGLPLQLTAGTWDQELGPDGEIESYAFVPGVEGVPPEEVSYQACTTSDQGRAVVALWMAAQASPVTEQHLRNQIEDPEYPLIEEFRNPDGTIVYGYQGLHGIIGVGQPYPWYALDFQIREAYYAHQLLDRPDDQALDLIHANWDQLTDPSTTTLDAVAILGLEPIPGFEDDRLRHEDLRFGINPPCG
jgi:hypothetical protein